MKCPYCQSENIDIINVTTEKKEKELPFAFFFMIIIFSISLLLSIIIVVVNSDLLLTALPFFTSGIVGLCATFAFKALLPYEHKSELFSVCKNCGRIIIKLDEVKSSGDPEE